MRKKHLHPARGQKGGQTTTNCFQGTLKSDAHSSDTLVCASVAFSIISLLMISRLPEDLSFNVGK